MIDTRSKNYAYVTGKRPVSSFDCIACSKFCSSTSPTQSSKKKSQEKSDKCQQCSALPDQNKQQEILLDDSLECEICFKKYRFKRHLEIHRNSHVNVNLPISCSLCSKFFPTMKSFTNHSNPCKKAFNITDIKQEKNTIKNNNSTDLKINDSLGYNRNTIQQNANSNKNRLSVSSPKEDFEQNFKKVNKISELHSPNEADSKQLKKFSGNLSNFNLNVKMNEKPDLDDRLLNEDLDESHHSIIDIIGLNKSSPSKNKNDLKSPSSPELSCDDLLFNFNDPDFTLTLCGSAQINQDLDSEVLCEKENISLHSNDIGDILDSNADQDFEIDQMEVVDLSSLLQENKDLVSKLLHSECSNKFNSEKENHFEEQTRNLESTINVFTKDDKVQCLPGNSKEIEIKLRENTELSEINKQNCQIKYQTETVTKTLEEDLPVEVHESCNILSSELLEKDELFSDSESFNSEQFQQKNLAFTDSRCDQETMNQLSPKNFNENSNIETTLSNSQTDFVTQKQSSLDIEKVQTTESTFHKKEPSTEKDFDRAKHDYTLNTDVKISKTNDIKSSSGVVTPCTIYSDLMSTKSNRANLQMREKNADEKVDDENIIQNINFKDSLPEAEVDKNHSPALNNEVSENHVLNLDCKTSQILNENLENETHNSNSNQDSKNEYKILKNNKEDIILKNSISDILSNTERTLPRNNDGHLERSMQQAKKNHFFKCSFCKFKTEKLYKLTIHLELHSDTTPFECPFCPQRLSQSLQLQLHIKGSHHNLK